MKASIAAALQSEAGNRGNASKCGKYLSVELTLHAWGSSIEFLQATSMLYALHGGEAERGHVGDSKPCLKDDWSSGLFISEKHSVDAKACLQSGGNLKLHFVGELRAAPNSQYAPAGSCRDCPLTVSPTVGMLIPLSWNWAPAWSIRVLKPTEEDSQDAPTPSRICQTVKLALKGNEDFNIELIALVHNWELSIPENDDDTVERRRAPFEHELDGQKTRCGNGPPASRCEALVAVRCSAPQLPHVCFSLVSANQLLHAVVPHPSNQLLHALVPHLSRFFSDRLFFLSHLWWTTC